MNRYLRISRIRQPRSNLATTILFACTFTLFALMAESRSSDVDLAVDVGSAPTLAGALVDARHEVADVKSFLRRFGF